MLALRASRALNPFHYVLTLCKHRRRSSGFLLISDPLNVNYTSFRSLTFSSSTTTTGRNGLNRNITSYRCVTNRTKSRYEAVKQALLRYKELHGNMRVPKKFVIPDASDVWPEEIWDMRLGSVVTSIRSGRKYAYRRDDLTSMGFDFNPQSGYGEELVKQTLLRYKELHGDMLVPKKFVVPDASDVWPEETWGMKLGTAAMRIRSGHAYGHLRDYLTSMGFDYNSQLRYGEELVKQALLRYKELHGDMLVPNGFVVPDASDVWPEETWGMRLGTVAKSIRSGTTYAYLRDDLTSMGFDYSSQSGYGGKLVKQALLRYKELHGDMLVPTRFVVPDASDVWPEETWGMKLGSVVANIRSGTAYGHLRDDLTSMGFDYGPQSGYGGKLVKQALLRYKELHGNMLIPTRFVVPDASDVWPEETWGMRLGTVATRIRSGTAYGHLRDDLTSMGLDYSPQSGYGGKLVKQALLRYKELHGNMLVPTRFVVPNNSDVWPEETWGMRLGTVVASIRSGTAYGHLRDDLTSMGFDYNSQLRYGEELVKQALLQYKKLHGNMRVPNGFIVLAASDVWPEETWGMRLGSVVANIRSGTTYGHLRDYLTSMGFDYSSQSGYGGKLVKQALLRYKELHGDMLLPYGFVVPDASDVWPEETWGMKLGTAAMRIRSGTAYGHLRDDLTSMGFDYSPQSRYGEELVKQALLRYKELHGNIRVPTRFVVPDASDVWPEETWGMRLGTVAKSLRSGTAYGHLRDDLTSMGLDYSPQHREPCIAELVKLAPA